MYAIAPVPEHCGNGAVNGAVPCLSASSFLPYYGSGAANVQTAFGNVGKNTLYGPGYFNIDTTLYKNVYITERIRFVIGASAYNLLNHPHFADPNSNIASGGFGTIGSTVSAPTSAYGAFQGSLVSGRELVLTAKFKF
jgi:hypothetical protein